MESAFGQATELPAWKKLEEHHNKDGRSMVLNDLFHNDPDRFKKFTRTFKNEADGSETLFDFSKNFLTEETLSILVQLAKDAKVEELRDAMFAGEKINFTEQRAVYHVALRNTENWPMKVDGKSVVEETNAVLDHMKEFCGQVRSGEWKGYTGKKMQTIINVGIGGSDLYVADPPARLITKQFQRTCHGHRGPEAVWRPQLQAPFCIQYRRHSHGRSAERF